MKMYHQGKLMRVVDIRIGNQAVAEKWHGSRRVWPDDSSRANALRIKLPTKGTEDWAYWVHAIDAVRRYGANENNYLRIKVGDKWYYLIDSIDGNTPLAIEGGMIYYENGELFPTEGLGDVVVAEAKIDERNLTALPFEMSLENEPAPNKGMVAGSTVPGTEDEGGAIASAEYGYSQFKVLLPFIPYMVFKADIVKGAKESPLRAVGRVTGNTGAECAYWYLAIVGSGRYATNFEGDTRNEWEIASHYKFEADNVYHANDENMIIDMWYAHFYRGGTRYSLKVTVGAFTRTWNLPVISVNQRG